MPGFKHVTLSRLAGRGKFSLLDDVAAFESCVSGPTIPHAPGCEEKDMNGDLDVDQEDFGLIQPSYSGAASRRTRCACRLSRFAFSSVAAGLRAGRC
jgi:hypothetical protein